VTKSRGTYVPQLDALRGIAVAAVAYSHWIAPQYQFGVRWGTVGVTLFFVLSGYLISGILLNCRAHSDRPFALRSFYARRFLRIFPLYYLVLLILVTVNLPPVRQTIFWHLAYLSNFYFLYHGGWHGPISIFWTLAVEEQFYLFWPTVLLFVPKRAVPWAIAGLFAVGLASRLLLPVFIPEKPLLIVLPNMSFAAFGIGAFLAYAKQRPELMKFVPYAAVGFPLFAVSLWMRSTGGFHYGPAEVEYLALILAFAWLIAKATPDCRGVLGALLALPPLVYLGRISYGVYLLHNFSHIPVRMVAEFLHVPALHTGAIGTLLQFAATLVAAGLSWRFFESPLNSLKRYFPYHSESSAQLDSALVLSPHDSV
jgi:peptidoglycan/LPS O-acetylase OafA/YrhL